MNWQLSIHISRVSRTGQPTQGFTPAVTCPRRHADAAHSGQRGLLNTANSMDERSLIDAASWSPADNNTRQEDRLHRRTVAGMASCSLAPSPSEADTQYTMVYTFRHSRMFVLASPGRALKYSSSSVVDRHLDTLDWKALRSGSKYRPSPFSMHCRCRCCCCRRCCIHRRWWSP